MLAREKKSDISCVFDDEDFIRLVLQSQLRSKMSKVVRESNLPLGKLACKSGVDVLKLEAIAAGDAKVTISDMRKILDALNYFAMENVIADEEGDC